MSEDEVKIILY